MAADFDNLRALAARAASDRVVPGLVVAVGRQGRTEFLEAFGARQVEPEVLPATTDTVYDLASLTKPLVTSVLAMQAVARGLLVLDAPVALAGGARAPEVTPRLLLAHAAGFAPHRSLHREVAHLDPERARAEVIRLARAEPPAYAPGAESRYSDLGFIVLGNVIEEAQGARLDALARQAIFAPLGLAHTGFLPAASGPAWVAASAEAGPPIAPTERCPVRERLIAGEVHDLNAWAMGGVAGHAGLFGPAGEIADLAHALVAAWRGGGSAVGAPPLVERDVAREFWRPAGIPGSTWRLGWDGPADHGSLAGARFSRAAVGHLGFTGCSLWIEPERETFVLILTNRVHPDVRDVPRFRDLRPALGDAALAALGA